MPLVEIPASLTRFHSTATGPEGRSWLAALPSLVEEACRRFAVSLGSPYAGGVAALVAPARLAGGGDAVLKVSFVDDESRGEPAALRIWDGRGAVRLLAEERDLGAMLLERAVPGTALLAHPDAGEALDIALAVLRRLPRALPPGHPFPSASAMARGLASTIPAELARLGEPFDAGLARAAGDVAAALSGGRDAALVNRDFHLGNVLAAQREPWLAIDPKPLAGEPAFDTGWLVRDVLARTPAEAGSAGRVVGQVASALDLPPGRVAAWALVRTVDGALWFFEIGERGDPFAHDVAIARQLAGLAAP
jgi:streptomycin 6-kinase